MAAIQNFIKDPAFATLPVRLQMPKEIKEKVCFCVVRYTCNTWEISELFRWLIYRVWNAVKSICGLSDWQKTHKSILPSLKNVAEPLLGYIPQMQVKGEVLTQGETDSETVRNQLLQTYDQRLSVIAQSCLLNLLELQSVKQFHPESVDQVLNLRALIAAYDFKNEIRCRYMYDDGGEAAQYTMSDSQDNKLLREALDQWRARGLLESFVNQI
jgi:hypothetical protein